MVMRYPVASKPATPEDDSRVLKFPWVRVDLNEKCFSVFFSIFPKFRCFPIGKNQEIPECRENTEKKLKHSPR